MAHHRVILVPVDMTAASDSALGYAAKELYRKGDVLHVLHISTTLSPEVYVQHSEPLPLPPARPPARS
jgi:hypothetical protein